MTGSGKLIQSSYQASFVLSDNLSTFQIVAVLKYEIKKCLDLFFDLQTERSRKLIDLKLIVHFKREISLVKINHFITQTKMVQIEWMVIKSVQYRYQTVSSFKILEPFTLFQES